MLALTLNLMVYISNIAFTFRITSIKYWVAVVLLTGCSLCNYYALLIYLQVNQR